MTYEKKQVHNVETGKIELIDLTPEEVAQRDAERAAAAALPEPKSEVDELRELIAAQAKRIEELHNLIVKPADAG